MRAELDLSVCCIKGCEKPSMALGLCVNHWRRNKKYGSPVALRQHHGLFIGLPVDRRFEMQVQKGPKCWLWKGGKDRDGYGCFRGDWGGESFARAHRFSFAFHKGPVGGGFVLHRCDTPSCVNPEHLFLGTNAENMADKMAKGRHRVLRGEDSKHAKLTADEARAIRADARPYAFIAHDYGVAAQTIASIKSGQSWRHVEGEVVKAKRVSPRKGVSEKFTPDDIRVIRASDDSGATLAKRYGCTPATICDIRKRRSWAHVI